MEMSRQLHAPDALRYSLCPLIRNVDEPKGRSKYFDGEKNPLLLPGIEPRFLVKGCRCVTILLAILSV